MAKDGKRRVAAPAILRLDLPLELDWVIWMRREVPDVVVHVMTDYSVGLMRLLSDGAMDIGVMYEPGRCPAW